MKDNKDKCRYCKLPIEKGLRNCPHCNTVNPSARVKEIFVWTLGMVVVLYIISYLRV